MWVNVEGASYVKAVINASGGMLGRIAVEVNGFDSTSFFVGGWDAARNGTNEFYAAFDVANHQGYWSGMMNVSTIRAINVLEPMFASPEGPRTPGHDCGAALTFVGWKTDGVAAPPSAPRTRRIELLGDSISAGFGSQGNMRLNKLGTCGINHYTSGIKGTYSWLIAEAFNADLVPIAWSGKGMYANSNGVTGLEDARMPQYWYQTLGGVPYDWHSKPDWDFSTYIPDMIIINLGTNDFSHDKNKSAAWESSFAATYTEFVLNATKIYKTPKLPVFVAQGPMRCDDELYAVLNRTIDAINAAGGNATYLDLKGPVDDGCGGHPGQAGHAAMAAMAIPQIERAMGWVAL